MKRLFALTSLLSLPLAAQSFGDGSTTGGSLVFSEGINPSANSARFDKAPAGWFFTFDDGDQKPGRDDLRQRPWALRRRAFGLSWGNEAGIRLAVGRETMNGFELRENQGFGNRSVVNRVVLGIGSGDGKLSTGYTVRFEQISVGELQGNADGSDALLGFSSTDRKALSFTIGGGFTYAFTERFRAGATVDRLIPRHFWGVYEKPQLRAGIQFDLNASLQASAEGDLIETARLPLPAKQRNESISLRWQIAPSWTMLLGAERRTLAGVSSIQGGLTLKVHTAPLTLLFGFQASDDRPLKSIAFRIGG
jgi:hypothetical protein